MGPYTAATLFASRHADAARFDVTLYGSLAATGKGHMTDVAILDALEPVAPVKVHWLPKIFLEYHSNAMQFKAFSADDALLEDWTVYSIGGGALSEGPGKEMSKSGEVYDMNSLTEIIAWCDANGRSMWEYVDLQEGPEIWAYLQDVWDAMKATVERGLNAVPQQQRHTHRPGVPGGLIHPCVGPSLRTRDPFKAFRPYFRPNSRMTCRF